MKICNKTKHSSFITYLDKNDFYAFSTSQNVPAGDFKWEKTNDNNEDVIKAMSTIVKMVILILVNLKYL